LEKIGWVVCIIDRRPSKNCKYISVTISKDNTDRYFASVLVQEQINQLPKTGKSVGIDLGLKDFCILSTGEKIDNPRWFRESQTKLCKAQKHFARKQKNSRRFKKCKLKVARLHKKVSDQRKHFHHELSTKLIKSFDHLGIENLNIKGMIKNRCLAKSIQDAGWAQFISFLEYKSVWYGKQVIKVGRFFASSKTCNHCGHKNTNLKLKDREWVCTSCGCVNDRDHNAAQNILQESLKIQAQGVA
jgi:putative transposase